MTESQLFEMARAVVRGREQCLALMEEQRAKARAEEFGSPTETYHTGVFDGISIALAHMPRVQINDREGDG